MTDLSAKSIRYSRQISLPQIGDAGQETLNCAHVLIVGAGGLGNPAGLYLATAGIGHIVISDFDSVDESNLPRQVVFRDSDVGAPKAEVLALRLGEANPDTHAIGISRRLDRDALSAEIEGMDAVLDCTDNFQSRWLLNEVCHAAKKPLISGAAIRLEGQLTVFRFDQQRSPCYHCLYNQADENLLDCAGQGILAPVAGTIGAMMATETIKLLCGIQSNLCGKLWLYDGLAGDARAIAIKQQSNCPVCSST
jgi:adenylyltransferase/sulfurtransferase